MRGGFQPFWMWGFLGELGNGVWGNGSCVVSGSCVGNGSIVGSGSSVGNGSCVGNGNIVEMVERGDWE